MSADLLAEFNDFYTASQNTAPSNQAPKPATTGAPASSNNGFGWQSQTQTSQLVPSVSNTQDDIWGDLSSFGSQPALQHTQKLSNDLAEDPWGTFETPIGPQSNSSFAAYNAHISQPTPATQSRPPPRFEAPQIVRRSTLDLINTPRPNSTNTAPKKAATFQPQSNNDVLFDAEDENTWAAEEENDDDFGDFETGTPSEPPAPAPASFAPPVQVPAAKSKYEKRPADLISNMASKALSPPLPYPQAPRSPSFHERNPFADLSLSTQKKGPLANISQPPSASPLTAWPSYEPTQPIAKPYVDSPVPTQANDDWGDFADLPPETPDSRMATAIEPNPLEADAWAWDAVDHIPPTANAQKRVTVIGPKSFPTSAPSAEVSVPTNIPPPSVILPILGQLFEAPNSTLFQPVANQKFSLKNVVLSDPKTITFLRSFVLIATVAARIIAGRKLRWKRDSILSQSMKIGPSTAGGKGGMKLTGVDKTETKREDREVADVVRIWKDQLGRLKSTVAIANTSIKDQSQHLDIPDINEVMVVRTSTSAEGALTAPKCCLLCGLKRDERVQKVDFNVEDSFGDWWAEYWGHKACKNFWEENEGKLKSR